MRYNRKIIKQRLESIPAEKRVWIYSAEIILEFLSHNFMPTKYFLTANGIIEAKTRALEAQDFIEKKYFKEKRLSVNDLYEQYLLFREKQDYTAEVETRFKFSMILNKLSYGQNGWEFTKARVSRKQVIMYGPFERRDGLTAEIRKDYPINKTTLEGSQVPVTMADMQTPDYDIEKQDRIMGKIVNSIAKTDYTKDWTEAIEKTNNEREWLETE